MIHSKILKRLDVHIDGQLQLDHSLRIGACRHNCLIQYLKYLYKVNFFHIEFPRDLCLISS